MFVQDYLIESTDTDVRLLTRTYDRCEILYQMASDKV